MSIIGKSVDVILYSKNVLTLFYDGVYNQKLADSSSGTNSFYTLFGTNSGTNNDYFYPSDSNHCISYTETQNDYGGIICAKAMSFEDYDFIRVIFRTVASYQDSNFKAQIYLLNYMARSVGASGISSYTTRVNINPNGDYQGTLHLKEMGGKYETFLPVTNYQSSGSYYLAFTCSSGNNNGIPNGIINIEKITLEKGTPAYSIPYMIYNGYDRFTNSVSASNPWQGGHAGGFVALQGTVNTQTDQIGWNTASGDEPYHIIYYENNNDYGGFRTYNKISFSGYSKLHIEMPYLESWQDSNYYASVVISTSAYTKTTSSGYITSYNEIFNIDKRSGQQELHIRGNSYNITIDISSYNSDYYIYILCARGNSASVLGKCEVSKIWLDND